MITQQTTDNQLEAHGISVLESRYQVRPEDLDCYAPCDTQQLYYLTDSQVKPDSHCYRFYVELVHKTEDRPSLLADIVVLTPSQTALNRVVRQSHIGGEYCVSRFWQPESNEPF